MCRATRAAGRGSVGGVPSRADAPRRASRSGSLSADQDVHRAGQVTESLESGRVDVDLLHVGGPAGLHVEGTTLHPTDGVLDGRVDVRGVTAGPDDPRGDVRLDGRVEVTAFEGTALRGDERRQVGGELGEQAAAGWAQQQRLHPHRPAQGQFGGHTRAERGPDDMALLDAEFGQRPGHIATSSTCEYEALGGTADSPKPRRSTRMTSRSKVKAAHWGSHIRRSATPA